MKIADFDYGLPTELIPSTPVRERGTARMVVVDRGVGQIRHERFTELPHYLTPGDVVVLNDTKVMPTLLQGSTSNGAEVRVDLVSDKGDGLWECHIRRIRETEPGTQMTLAGGQIHAEVLGLNAMGTGHVLRLDVHGEALINILFEQGRYMLPMYLDQNIKGSDYQTVFANEPGSNQPPVAGMHFTPSMLDHLSAAGVEVAHITLRIGRLDDLGLLGGSRPVEEHKMYPEAYEVSEQAANQVNDAHARGNKVLCVGTTTVRTLETVADESGWIHAGSDWTNHFITPGYTFKTVDALMSNLQPPFSTNIMLHSAFGGHELVMRAYTEAVERRYQFLEFGDCILYV
ncbi:S-adenosylmethionine:tRNA ribosyltransferase-isomerase [Actinomyces ruminicola]|uniref:S-adenosylmethionine:tRNA ribosyltransferase-isomerase n=1 Tax=Actinomyces ruminicola TaxID=332524 RepID=UPI0011C7E17A|nr:S-adenosylmethionine:tRNA ribosyltransferase-isomerase [Actinomyces ruminicola]